MGANERLACAAYGRVCISTVVCVIGLGACLFLIRTHILYAKPLFNYSQGTAKEASCRYQRFPASISSVDEYYPRPPTSLGENWADGILAAERKP